ncbi:AIR carboxylase family protein [Candidatus Woesearchaeota archaeon]|nr:AIR carboxylase family protein [Candidatus Woesearchaeota archaeon]
MDALVEQQYRDAIAVNLNNVVASTFIPEFGFPFSGKVRDIYDLGDVLLMLTSDRVSAFDIVHQRQIPFKGAVLNGLSLFGFDLTSDIVPNAIISSPDPYAIVQEKLEKIEFEFVVRGYMWGSLAEAYEQGEHSICGIGLPEGLLRYQKLPEPLFTPTTKSPSGHHDIPVTLDQILNGFKAPWGKVTGLAERYGLEKGKQILDSIKRISIQNYLRVDEHARSVRTLFIDTKYEFGIDRDGQIKLIDEANTPDSSRMVDLQEHHDKWSQIDALMRTNGNTYRHVSELLKVRGDLKIKELSKEYLREKLIALGYKKGDTVLPDISPDVIIETALRYIETYERFTGRKFDFVQSELAGAKRLMHNLVKAGLAQGYCAVVVAGSDSDAIHVEKIRKSLDEYGVPNQVRVVSAHKQPNMVSAMVKFYDRQSIEPLLWVTVAGGVDALSGSVSWESRYPTVSCPPDAPNESCLNNPAGSPNATIYKPKNVGKFAAQAFSWINPKLAERISQQNANKVEGLEAADELARTGKFEELLKRHKR